MASEQAKKKAEEFFHHDKPESETAPVDPEFGKHPAKDPVTKYVERKEGRAAEGKQPDVDRMVKDSLAQADEYGREMSVAQTLPQTLIDVQDPFGQPGHQKGSQE